MPHHNTLNNKPISTIVHQTTSNLQKNKVIKMINQRINDLVEFETRVIITSVTTRRQCIDPYSYIPRKQLEEHCRNVPWCDEAQCSDPILINSVHHLTVFMVWLHHISTCPKLGIYFSRMGNSNSQWIAWCEQFGSDKVTK